MASNMAAIFRNSRWRPRWLPCREHFHKLAMGIILIEHMNYFVILYVSFVIFRHFMVNLSQYDFPICPPFVIIDDGVHLKTVAMYGPFPLNGN